MTRRRAGLGDALFWIFFVPYIAGVMIFLIAGVAPSVVKESGWLHEQVHEIADDALLAEHEVTIRVRHDHHEPVPRLVIVGRAGEDPLVVRPVITSGRQATFEFRSPAAGSYTMTAGGHPDLKGEIRFADDGARSVAVRVPHGQTRFERVGTGGWSEVAHRVGDASHRADHGARVTLETLFSALNLGLGLVLVVRRPRDRTARLLAVAMVGTAITFNHQAHSTVRDYLIGDWWFAHDLAHLLSGVAYMYAVIVFPDGRLLPFGSRHRWLLRVAYGIATLVLAANVLGGRVEGHPGQRFFTLLFGLLIPLAGVAAQTYRLRRATDPVVRQQSLLLRWALLPLLGGGLTYLVLTRAFGSSVEDIGFAVFPVLFALVPLALIMGILRYRLWDLDLFVSRALLSVGLAAFIGLVYVTVVVVVGQVIGSGGSTGLKVVATAIVALAFEPVRERLGRVANRLVYGERATPYEVMAQTGDRLAGAISVDEILPDIAEATVRGTGAVAGQVTAFLPGGGSTTVEWPAAGTATSFPIVVPVSYCDEEVGRISLATVHGERLRPEAEELLAALAAQAGIAVNNARLTIELEARLREISAQADELRASRQRIVAARHAQRQRVVQLIRTRVEVRLDRASAMLDGLGLLLRSDLDDAVDQIDRLVGECGDALDALRALARGIFPAILADQGLGPALDAYVRQADLRTVDVRLDGLDGSRRHDPQAEATVYFCVVQAVANAGTYAPGSDVVVLVHGEPGRLAFSVSDDGPGADPVRLRNGNDVRDMRDRVEAVGGAFEATTAPGEGTVISGSVPARVAASVPEPAS
jgi:signal transduction histidine kinase